jgi:methionyl-tRNA formyltransferase
MPPDAPTPALSRDRQTELQMRFLQVQQTFGNATSMNVIFAGTPDFAADALAAIIAAGHDVRLVLTQPDRPAGRGMQVRTSAVKALAVAHRLTVFQPQSLKDSPSQTRLREAQADLMIVAAYGLILPQAVLDIPPLGCINIHASLLPRWRGAAPVQRAIEAGDAVTGVTIMRMEAGLDTGPMLLAEPQTIAPDDTADSLLQKLAAQGARLIVTALADLDHLHPVTQQPEGVTYARKIDKNEAALDWRLPAELLARRVRAFNPFPGTTAQLNAASLKVWHASEANGTGVPGTVLGVSSLGIDVACGHGALRLHDLQKSGGRRLSAEEFMRGFAITPGEKFAVADGRPSGAD